MYKTHVCCEACRNPLCAACADCLLALIAELGGRCSSMAATDDPPYRKTAKLAVCKKHGRVSNPITSRFSLRPPAPLFCASAKNPGLIRSLTDIFRHACRTTRGQVLEFRPTVVCLQEVDENQYESLFNKELVSQFSEPRPSEGDVSSAVWLVNIATQHRMKTFFLSSRGSERTGSACFCLPCVEAQ